MKLIEKYLPVFHFIERHRLLVTAAPVDLLDAVTLAGTIDDPWVSRAVRIRELPGRLLAALGRGNALEDRAAFGLNDFTLLGRDSDREIAFGLAGQFWKIDYGLVTVHGPDEFEVLSAIGVPKLELNFSVESADAGHVWLCTETRIFCNDRKSFFRFLPYWWMIRPVSGLMRRRLLLRIRNAADRCGFAVDKPRSVPSHSAKQR